MLQSQYCFQPAESKFIKHLIFKAAVVINACLHYDCTPRQRENGVQKNDCMMGIPTETTRDKGGDMKSLSQSAECI